MGKTSEPKLLKTLEITVVVAIILVTLGLSWPSLFEKRHSNYRIPNLIEAEDLKVAKKGLNIFFQKQDTSGYQGYKWSNDTQMFGMAYESNVSVDLVLPSKGPGNYRLSAFLTKGNDYGIVQFYIDGKKLGEPIDLFSKGPNPVPTGKVLLGEIPLEVSSVLRIEVIGKNSENISPHLFFGIDGIILEKI